MTLKKNNTYFKMESCIIGIYLPIMILKWSGDNVVQIDDLSVKPEQADSYILCEKSCDYNPPSDVGKCNFSNTNLINVTERVSNYINNSKGSCEAVECGDGGAYYNKYDTTVLYDCNGIAWRGKFNSNTSSSIGQSIHGEDINCLDCNFNQFTIDEKNRGGWSLTYNNTNHNNGSVQMRYTFFSDNITQDTLYTLDNKFNDLLTGKINTINVSLPKNVTNYMINFTLLYGIVNVFYNQIYQQNSYQLNTNNPFMTCNRLDSLDLFKKNLCNNQYFKYKNIDFIKFPNVSQDGTDFYITLNLSYQLSQQLFKLNKDKQESLLNDYLNNFLRDNEGKLNNNTLTQAQFSLKRAVTDFSSGDKGRCTVMNVDEIDMKVEDMRFPFKDFSFNLSDNYFLFLSLPITLKVEKWSVMLVAYFNRQEEGQMITFDDDTIAKIIKDTGTRPYNKTKTKDDIQNFCPNTYYFTSYPLNSTLGKYILNSESDNDCNCYSSHLGPYNDYYPNITAMCYSKFCSSDMTKLFGIVDEKCEEDTRCKEMDDWIKNGTSQNPSEIDETKFKKFCPYIPPTDSSVFNTDFFMIGIFITLLMTVLIFLICKNKSYENLSIFLCTSSVFIVLSLISYYSSIFLTGEYICKNDKGKLTIDCVSKKYKDYSILSEFCSDSFKPLCECISENSCGPNCTCHSHACYPKDGERKTQTVYTRKIKYTLIISSIIVSILFPLLFLYASVDYDWHINKKISILIIVIVSIIPLVYMLVKTLKKNEITVYDKQNCTV